MASSPRDILAIVLQLNRHAVLLNDGNRLHGHREILVNYAPGGFIGVFVLLLFDVTVQPRLLQRNFSQCPINWNFTDCIYLSEYELLLYERKIIDGGENKRILVLQELQLYKLFLRWRVRTNEIVPYAMNGDSHYSDAKVSDYIHILLPIRKKISNRVLNNTGKNNAASKNAVNKYCYIYI